MKYTVTINEKSKTVTVTLTDGTQGVAKCCPTDQFNINTGIELALERAKVAKANKKTTEIKPSPMATQMSVTMLVKQLEKALPEGQMVVVGNGKKMTEAQKEWLRSLVGGCDCKCHETDEYENGYDEGYADGYADAEADYDDEDNNNEIALERIREVLADVGII